MPEPEVDDNGGAGVVPADEGGAVEETGLVGAVEETGLVGAVEETGLVGAVGSDVDDLADESAGAGGEAEDDPESAGAAYAMPGVVATAAPTPRATANAPIRPMCLA